MTAVFPEYLRLLSGRGHHRGQEWQPGDQEGDWGRDSGQRGPSWRKAELWECEKRAYWSRDGKVKPGN